MRTIIFIRCGVAEIITEDPAAQIQVVDYDVESDDVETTDALHEASRKYGEMSMTELCNELSLLSTMLYKMRAVQPQVVTLLATAEYRLRNGWANNQAQLRSEAE